MGKRIFVLLSFVTLILASSLPLEKAQAIKSIPDGGATYNDGYRAYKDARDVNSTVKSMWDNGRNGVNPTAKKGNLTFVREVKTLICIACGMVSSLFMMCMQVKQTSQKNERGQL